MHISLLHKTHSAERGYVLFKKITEKRASARFFLQMKILRRSAQLICRKVLKKHDLRFPAS